LHLVDCLLALLVCWFLRLVCWLFLFYCNHFSSRSWSYLVAVASCLRGWLWWLAAVVVLSCRIRLLFVSRSWLWSSLAVISCCGGCLSPFLLIVALLRSLIVAFWLLLRLSLLVAVAPASWFPAVTSLFPVVSLLFPAVALWWLRSLLFAVVVGCCVVVSCGFVGVPCFLRSWLVVVCRGCIGVSCGCRRFLRLCRFSRDCVFISRGCCCGRCFLRLYLIVAVAPSISWFCCYFCGCFMLVTGIVGCRGCCCCLLLLVHLFPAVSLVFPTVPSVVVSCFRLCSVWFPRILFLLLHVLGGF